MSKMKTYVNISLCISDIKRSIENLVKDQDGALFENIWRFSAVKLLSQKASF